MMDSGQLDFYQHSTLCTNTCRSTKFDLLINNTRFPPDGTGLATPTSSQGECGEESGRAGRVICGGVRNDDLCEPAAQVVQGNGGTAGEDKADILSGRLDWSSPESADKKESSEISG